MGSDASPLDELKSRLRQRIHTADRPSRAPRATGRMGALSLSPGDPGPYHHAGYLHCTDCHIVHASKDGTAFGGGLPNPTGYQHLLRQATALEVCLACHEGTAGIPDVVEADVNGLVQRPAGAFTTPETDNPSGHNLGANPGYLCTRCHFGGDMATAQVTCIDCHDPHGNTIPRNLQWASDPASTPPLGLLIDPAASGLDRYEAAHVAYGTDGTSNLREVTNMCLDCHHILSGASYTDPDGNGIYEKHPVSETERGAVVPVSQGDLRGTTDSAHWVAGSGAGFEVPRLRFVANPAITYAAASTVSASNNVFCLSCHRVHGTTTPGGVAWDPNLDTSIGPAGCDQCHKKSA